MERIINQWVSFRGPNVRSRSESALPSVLISHQGLTLVGVLPEIQKSPNGA